MYPDGLVWRRIEETEIKQPEWGELVKQGVDIPRVGCARRKCHNFLLRNIENQKLNFMKKFLQADYSAASNRVYASLIDLRSNGIFIIDFDSGASSRDFFR